MSHSADRPALGVELRQCSRRYGERVALRRVSLAVAPGERVILTGANGAGKSTLLRLVAGLARPTAGEVLIEGTPAAEAGLELRGRIGYVAHRPLVYRHLTARENLVLLARLHGRDPDGASAALAAAGLGDRPDDRVDGFSRGMLQRLALARIALLAPGLLLLDEPTTGLDTEGIAVLDALIEATAATVLAATHDDAFAARHGFRRVRLVLGEAVP
jgi:heme exporter protein A